MKNEVNTIYVAAASAADITAVSSEISTRGRGDRDHVQRPGQRGHRLAVQRLELANNLGKWLAIAGGFGLASLLTVSAVSRRVREFGTLRATSWDPPDPQPDHG